MNVFRRTVAALLAGTMCAALLGYVALLLLWSLGWSLGAALIVVVLVVVPQAVALATYETLRRSEAAPSPAEVPTATERDGTGLALGAAARVGARLPPAVCLLALGTSYPILSAHLAWPGGVQATTFHLAYGLAAVALLGLVVRAPTLLAIMGPLIRRMPLRSAVLALSLSLALLFVVYVGQQWGVIAAMMLAACGVLAYMVAPEPKQTAIADETLRYGPIACLIVYAALVAGEVYLHFHPAHLGGGGGGNPALHQEYIERYSFNSLGLRDVEFSRARPDGVVRILALGDSFTFGQGVSAADTYPERLEALLNAGGRHRKFEVINAGKGGVDTQWELAFLTRDGFGLEPDLVTVQFYENDISVARTLPAFDRFLRPLGGSYVLFFMRARLSAVLGSHDRTDRRWRRVKEIANNGPGWRACAQAWREFGAVSRRTAIPIVAVLFPHPGEPHEASRIIHQAVADQCRKAGIHVVDLTDAFGSIDPAAQILSEMDHHPSARMYDVAAARILDALRRDGLIPAADDR